MLKVGSLSPIMLLKQKLDDGITPTIEYILSVPNDQSHAAVTREIMQKVGVSTSEELYDLRLALKSLNTSSYVYINAAAVKLGVSQDYFSNSEMKLCNFLYGEIEKSRGREIINQNDIEITQDKNSNIKSERNRKQSGARRQIGNLFTSNNNKSLNEAYSSAKKEISDVNSGLSEKDMNIKLTPAVLNYCRYITHSVLFGPVIFYKPSNMTDFLVKLFVKLNDKANSRESRNYISPYDNFMDKGELMGSKNTFTQYVNSRTKIGMGEYKNFDENEGYKNVNNSPSAANLSNNPVIYLPDIPYAGPGSTTQIEDCGHDINYTILDSFVQYIMGSGVDVFSDADEVSGNRSIYNWDVYQYIKFINQISGRHLFNIKGSDLRKRIIIILRLAVRLTMVLFHSNQ